MGKTISKPFKMALRPIRNVNIDRRVEKFISKDKPTPAPMYDSTKEQLKMAKQIHPMFMEEHNKKDEGLMDKLKQVYVTSEDKQSGIVPEGSERALPKGKEVPHDFEYGFWEPEAIPPGKISLRMAIDILAKHAVQPMVYNKAAIAKKYNIDPLLAENLVTYYGILTLVKPKVEDSLDESVADRIKGYLKKIDSV